MTKAFTIWLTGIPGAGKTTIARELVEVLGPEIGGLAHLDGDDIRRDALYTLGFDRKDRDTNIRVLAYVARTLNLHGTPAVVAAISPYEETRLEARKMIDQFVEVHVECPVEVCIERDPKGLYKRALAGEIPNLTGLNDPYEAPSEPEIKVATATESAGDSAARIIEALRGLGHI